MAGLIHLALASTGLASALWLAPPASEKPVPAAPPAPAAPEPAAPEPEPTPEPAPAAVEPSPPAPEPAGPPSDDLERVRAEARVLQDEVFKARARVATVAGKLLKSRVTFEMRTNLERFYEITDFVVTLDGAPVYHRDAGLGPNDGPLFDVYAAPGSHELGVSAELVARRDRTYTLRVDQSFGIVVPERSTVSARLVIRETGDMWRFGKRGRGRYDLRFALRARAKKTRENGKPRTGAAAKGAAK